MREALPDRYRCRRGRIMHRVYRVPHHGTEPDLESLCRERIGPKGATSTMPRAWGPESDWSKERYDYPDCTHCPPETESGGRHPQ